MHISLGVLTIAKWHLAKIGAPVVKLVTRDGALTAGSICCEPRFKVPKCYRISHLFTLNSLSSALYAVVISYALFTEVSQAHVVFKYVPRSI